MNIKNIISAEQIGNRKNANQAHFVLYGSYFGAHLF